MFAMRRYSNSYLGDINSNRGFSSFIKAIYAVDFKYINGQ